ncbi:[protein-PII] uridylyltransferase [Glaciecola petra]|uniref:Bifunctional uridylyltransferase/uridylyl-removing enzyme n=1 Tax=Glaciecola petra TaxID=3075602 RepID=A0ABU2ZNR2_9ALTE|nr:[protein-PII] uridylyltransferase [Aestuariibacter sp. P117]MDT0593693.1 [protein-PII] uridylyltransferase [Aestuariibacter sp. P117]
MVNLETILANIQEIESIGDIGAFRSCVSDNLSWLKQNFNSVHVDELVVKRAEFTDILLRKAWCLQNLENVKGLSLVAVGGYGRGQMQPYSDIDLLILSDKTLKPDVQERISSFITFLWDIKLEIGQSVRTVKDTLALAKDDITIATNLVEARLLIGCDKTFTKLSSKLTSHRIWSSKNFFLAKLEEQKARHKKFNDTSYNLEPNIKENPGCLRDIQNIGWVAKQHFNEYDGMTLIGHGYFTELEHAELIECRSNLWQIRFALHLVAKRSENRLLFDFQTDVAELLGFGNGKAGVEKMMKHLFRIVRRVSELNSMLMLRFKQDILNLKVKRRRELNANFCVEDGLISPTSEECFASPMLILEFLDLLSQHKDIEGLDANCIRLLRNARREFQSAYYHQIPECRVYFIKLVSNPDFFDLAWDVMHKHGILQSYLPEWDKIVGMMQFDLFHAYTVDEHTHRLVKHVRSYYTKAEEFPRCNKIVNNADKPEILFLTAIFHDIAKGRGGDHSVLGEKDVRVFCVDHDLDNKDVDIIAWLVKHHLLMSVVAQRRDIYDPEVVREFASTVKSHEQLDLLYALTLADIRATNDSLWNDWKASLLRELYQLTRKALDNGLQCQMTLNERIKDYQSKTIKLLADKNIDESQYLPFWEQFNQDYFARYSPKQIAWHTQCIIEAGELSEKDILVSASNDTSKAGTELLIFCQDKPALFAQIASVLDSRNCSIHDAQISVTRSGYVFDSMIILDQDGKRIESQTHINTLVKTIHAQLTKPGRSHSNSRKMSRRMKQLDVPTKVRFYSSQAESTLIELEALDAPGLLAKIGHLFVDLKFVLKMAKISTIGERAEDVFIVSNEDGNALTQEQQVVFRKQLKLKLDQPEVNHAI